MALHSANGKAGEGEALGTSGDFNINVFLCVVFVSFTVAVGFLYHAHPSHTVLLLRLPTLTMANSDYKWDVVCRHN